MILVRVASVLTGLAVVAGGLSVVASVETASAASTPVLRWAISQQFDEHLSTHALSDGASETSDGVVTFPGGVGTYDPATGVTSVDYQGAVRGAFAFAGSEFYHVTIEDPSITIDAAGKGRLTALVSAANIANGSTPAEETQPQRVVVTTFSVPVGGWQSVGDLAALTATPDWAGVLPPGSDQATSLGISDTKPTDGKAFNPAFLAQITSGVRPHFYASGASSDAKKAPAVFVAQATPVGDVAPTRPNTLSWPVSSEFNSAFALSYADGATAADGVITFPEGSGSFDEATGVASVSYAGSVTGTVAGTLGGLLGLDPGYSVTIAQPTLSVDATGAGTLTASVSATQTGYLPGVDGTSNAAQRVTLTTVTAAKDRWLVDGSSAILTATPAWAGVLPAGSSDATNLGIPAGQPVDGKAFATAFLSQITSAARAHFYATESDQDTKAPGAFTAVATAVAASPSPSTSPSASATTSPSASPTSSLSTSPSACSPSATNPATTVTTVSSDPETGLTLDVAGTRFRAVSCDGDAGVYVGLAPAGGLPDVSTMDLSKFAAVAYVMPQQISGGAFATSLNAAADSLDPDLTYAVYTWQAHTHSNTTQDTQKKVAIDWVSLGLAQPTKPSTITLQSSRPTTTKTGSLVAWVRPVNGSSPKPTGRARLILRFNGERQGKARFATLNASGRATFKLAKAKPGKWKVTVRYLGDRAYSPSTRSASYKVKKSSAAKNARRAAAPSVQISTVTQNACSLVLNVTGSGFDPAYNAEAKEDGLYVGLAPAGGLPDVDNLADQSNFVPGAFAWIGENQLGDGGTFSTRLTADPLDLDPSTGYAIYTWQAHRHTNTASDTETAADIAPFTRGASKVTLKPSGKKMIATLTTPCRSAGALGKVRFTFTRGSATVTKKVKLTAGNGSSATASAKVSGLKAGTWKAIANYPGNARFTAAKATKKFKR